MGWLPTRNADIGAFRRLLMGLLRFSEAAAQCLRLLLKRHSMSLRNGAESPMWP